MLCCKDIGLAGGCEELCVSQTKQKGTGCTWCDLGAVVQTDAQGRYHPQNHYSGAVTKVRCARNQP